MAVASSRVNKNWYYINIFDVEPEEIILPRFKHQSRLTIQSNGDKKMREVKTRSSFPQIRAQEYRYIAPFTLIAKFDHPPNDSSLSVMTTKWPLHIKRKEKKFPSTSLLPFLLFSARGYHYVFNNSFVYILPPMKARRMRVRVTFSRFPFPPRSHSVVLVADNCFTG